VIGITVSHFLGINICVAFVPSFVPGYPEFGFHLNRTGRAMVYSCSWPVYQIYSGISVSTWNFKCQVFTAPTKQKHLLVW